MILPNIVTPLFGIGLTEGVVIIVAILVLFGATRLPKLGKGIGEGIRNFKTGIKGEDAAPPNHVSSSESTPSKNDTP